MQDIQHRPWVDLIQDPEQFEALARDHYQAHCRHTDQDFHVHGPIPVDSAHFLSLPTQELEPFQPAMGQFHRHRPAEFHQTFPDTLRAARLDAESPQLLALQRQLGLDLMHCQLQTQLPGRMVALHTDTNRSLANMLVARGWQQRALVRHMRKHIIYLADWQPGQLFMCGRSVHANWKQGDVLSFPWHMPHSTANTGFHPRPTLFVAGIAL